MKQMRRDKHTPISSNHKASDRASWMVRSEAWRDLGRVTTILSITILSSHHGGPQASPSNSSSPSESRDMEHVLGRAYNASKTDSFRQQGHRLGASASIHDTVLTAVKAQIDGKHGNRMWQRGV